MKYLLVFLGSGLGGSFRFFISSLLNKFTTISFPFGTLTVNILGSFLLGVLFFGFDTKEYFSPELKLLLAVGFCGGFTTFSTFSLETVNLIKDSHYLFASLNIFGNLILSIVGVYLGYLVTK